MGPRFEVNASAGSFEFPFTDQGMTGNAIYKRLQVHDEDLDPVLNPGALYFIEGQQIAADDGAAGMLDNNASHRQVAVTGGEGVFNLVMVGPTVQRLPAIRAWAAIEQDVLLETVDVEDDGRLFVASKATPLGGGMWRYEYAVHNLNSHRTAGSVGVPISSGALVTGVVRDVMTTP